MNERPILVTGGAGFIGTNFAHHMVDAGHRVITLDALTYAGNRSNLAALDDLGNHTFIEGSIADAQLIKQILLDHKPSSLVNFAAESHVDRSIDEPSAFIDTNIFGVYVLLETVRSHVAELGGANFRLLHVSTDEVYGSIEKGASVEASPYAPTSPYAASKAAADHLVQAWWKTYGVPTIITNCTNNYGPYQFPEKLIPLVVRNALKEVPLPIYGDGRQERDWLFVADHCNALSQILENAAPGETFNIASGAQKRNIEVVSQICDVLDRLRPRSNAETYKDLITHVEDRPGHDVRYSVDATKLRETLGWRPAVDFQTGIERTIQWYLANRDWIEDAGLRYAGERLGNLKNG